MVRTIVDILILISVFIFPWWVAFIVAVIVLFLFRSYYEILFLGIIIDSLYNAPIAIYFHMQFIVTFAAIILFIIAEAIKPRLRFYN